VLYHFSADFWCKSFDKDFNSIGWDSLEIFMDQQILIVFGVILFAVVAFSFEIFRSDVVALVVMALLIFSGVLSPEDAVKGFSNSATVTVACMFVLSAGFLNAGLLHWITDALKRWKNPKQFPLMILLMLISGVVSAFINNTAAVVVLIPVVIRIAKDANLKRKPLLMALSYSAIFGGACTLIGTSTNILANSIYQGAGFPGFSMFEFSKLGIIIGLVGAIYFLTFGTRLLSKDEGEPASMEVTRYLTEVAFMESSPSVGSSLKESPFYRDFEGNILEIRNSAGIRVGGKNPVLNSGDRVKLICNAEKIQMLGERAGLSILDKQVSMNEEGLKQWSVLEAIVPSGSRLVGESLAHSFEGMEHEIKVLGVLHRGENLLLDLRKRVMNSGDVLLLAGSEVILEGLGQDQAIIPLSRELPKILNLRKMIFMLSVTCLVIFFASIGVISILGSAIIGCILLILFRVLSIAELYRALDAKVLILLGAMLSLGAALSSTGAAEMVSHGILSYFGRFGPQVILAAIYLTTSLLTEIMSNNATVALLTPIALSVATDLGVSEKPFVLAVMLAGSASFMTPIGYQTNTLIYSSGGFRFKDFLRVGTPLNIIFWICTVFLVPIFFEF